MTTDYSEIFSCTTYVDCEDQRTEHAVHSIFAKNWEEAKIEAARFFLPYPKSSLTLTHTNDVQIIQRAVIARLE